MATTELSTVLETELASPSIVEALPPDFNRARFVQNCMALVTGTPELAKYPKEKLVPGLLKGAYLGLDFFNKECYLIPYGSDLNFQIDYKGMTKLVKKYSIRPVNDIYARIVREGDEFKEGVEHNEPFINFNPKPFNTGKILGAFAVCQFADGGIKYEVMSKDELDIAKRMSKAQSGTAWQHFSGEMYKKTVLRRLCKNIPMDMDFHQTQIIDGEYEETTVVREEATNPWTTTAETPIYDISPSAN